MPNNFARNLGVIVPRLIHPRTVQPTEGFPDALSVRQELRTKDARPARLIARLADKGLILGRSGVNDGFVEKCIDIMNNPPADISPEYKRRCAEVLNRLLR